ncbi:hypothetical protein ABTX34_26945 [Streptomyces sp. NPDC096538]|uniref:hypothetical protein n=1 Tax=Streptomyces sp. NPDC096538 TaxID=3155427 RepID=UPI00331A707B
MNTFARRVSLAVASVAIASGAALAAPGHAMAVSSVSEKHSTRISTSGRAEDDRVDHRYVARAEHDERRDGNLGRHSETDGRDDRRVRSADQTHRALSAQDRDHRWDERQPNDRTWDKVEYRWDGHRLYRLVDGRWIDVTPYRHGVVDRWYVDQLIMAQR